MTKDEAGKLKLGDEVRWPGSEASMECLGVVTKNKVGARTLYIAWDDGQETYSSDFDALENMELVCD